MRWVLAAGVIALFAATMTSMALVACHAQLPKPELGAHVATDRGVCVPYPPPAARAEEIPPRLDPASVWIDGEWAWAGRRWRWRKGRWEVPPAGALYARSSTLRLENGALAHFPGHWWTPELNGADASGDGAFDVESVLRCPAPKPVDAAAHDAEASAPDALTTSAAMDADADADTDADANGDGRSLDEPPWLSDAPLDIIAPPK